MKNRKNNKIFGKNDLAEDEDCRVHFKKRRA